MKKHSILFLVGFSLGLTACKQVPPVGGGWSIEGYEGARPLLTNGLELYKDGTCALPMTDISERHTPLEEGKWEAFKEKGHYYLRITTPHPQFNDTYEITSLKQVTDTVSWGQLTVMELRSNRTWMLCKRADYGPRSNELSPPKAPQ